MEPHHNTTVSENEIELDYLNDFRSGDTTLPENNGHRNAIIERDDDDDDDEYTSDAQENKEVGRNIKPDSQKNLLKLPNGNSVAVPKLYIQPIIQQRDREDQDLSEAKGSDEGDDFMFDSVSSRGRNNRDDALTEYAAEVSVFQQWRNKLESVVLPILEYGSPKKGSGLFILIDYLSKLYIQSAHYWHFFNRFWWLETISRFILLLQLLGLIFEQQLPKTWGSVSYYILYWFNTVIRGQIVDFPWKYVINSSSAQSLVPVLFLVAVLYTSSLLLATIVNSSLKTRKFYSIENNRQYTLESLRMTAVTLYMDGSFLLLSFLLHILPAMYIPCLVGFISTGLRPYTYENTDFATWVFCGISAVGLAILILLTFLYTLSFYEWRPPSPLQDVNNVNIMSRAHPYLDLIVMAIATIMVGMNQAMTPFFDKDQIVYAITGANTGLIILLGISVVYLAPFYHIFVNRIIAISAISLVFAAVTTLFTALLNRSGTPSEYPLIAWAVSNIAALLVGFIASILRLDILASKMRSKSLPSYKQAYLTALDMDIANRYMLGSQSNINYCQKAYQENSPHFAKSSFFHISWATFTAFQLKNPVKALEILSQIEHVGMTIDMVLMYHIRREYWRHCLHYFPPEDVQRIALKKAREQQFRARKLLVTFWNVLSSNLPQKDTFIPSLNFSLMKYQQKAKKIYMEILGRYPSPEVYREFARFLLDVCNDPEGYERYMSIAHDLQVKDNSIVIEREEELHGSHHVLHHQQQEIPPATVINENQTVTLNHEVAGLTNQQHSVESSTSTDSDYESADEEKLHQTQGVESNSDTDEEAEVDHFNHATVSSTHSMEPHDTFLRKDSEDMGNYHPHFSAPPGELASLSSRINMAIDLSAVKNETSGNLPTPQQVLKNMLPTSGNSTAQNNSTVINITPVPVNSVRSARAKKVLKVKDKLSDLCSVDERSGYSNYDFDQESVASMGEDMPNDAGASHFFNNKVIRRAIENMTRHNQTFVLIVVLLMVGIFILLLGMLTVAVVDLALFRFQLQVLGTKITSTIPKQKIIFPTQKMTNLDMVLLDKLALKEDDTTIRIPQWLNITGLITFPDKGPYVASFASISGVALLFAVLVCIPMILGYTDIYRKRAHAIAFIRRILDLKLARNISLAQQIKNSLNVKEFNDKRSIDYMSEHEAVKAFDTQTIYPIISSKIQILYLTLMPMIIFSVLLLGQIWVIYGLHLDVFSFTGNDLLYSNQRSFSATRVSFLAQTLIQYEAGNDNATAYATYLDLHQTVNNLTAFHQGLRFGDASLSIRAVDGRVFRKHELFLSSARCDNYTSILCASVNELVEKYTLAALSLADYAIYNYNVSDFGSNSTLRELYLNLGYLYSELSPLLEKANNLYYDEGEYYVFTMIDFLVFLTALLLPIMLFLYFFYIRTLNDILTAETMCTRSILLTVPLKTVAEYPELRMFLVDPAFEKPKLLRQQQQDVLEQQNLDYKSFVSTLMETSEDPCIIFKFSREHNHYIITSLNQQAAQKICAGNDHALIERPIQHLFPTDEKKVFAMIEKLNKSPPGKTSAVSELLVVKTIEGKELHVTASMNSTSISGIRHYIAFLKIRHLEEQDLVRNMRDKVNKLMHQNVPPMFLERIAAGDLYIHHYLPYATVMHINLYHFSAIADRMKPAEMIALLDQVFAIIDKMVLRYNMWKVKTSGNSYICIGAQSFNTTPEQMLLKHDDTYQALNFSLHLIKKMKKFAQYINIPVRLRIGVHTGPCVAAVTAISPFVTAIGSTGSASTNATTINQEAKQYFMDIHGEAPRVANELQQSCEPNKTRVSMNVYVRGYSQFEFENCGKSKLHSKMGAQEFTYYLRKAIPASKLNSVTPTLDLLSTKSPSVPHNHNTTVAKTLGLPNGSLQPSAGSNGGASSSHSNENGPITPKPTSTKSTIQKRPSVFHVRSISQDAKKDLASTLGEGYMNGKKGKATAEESSDSSSSSGDEEEEDHFQVKPYTQ